jgi:hypothetical protein
MKDDKWLERLLAGIENTPAPDLSLKQHDKDVLCREFCRLSNGDVDVFKLYWDSFLKE